MKVLHCPGAGSLLSSLCSSHTPNPVANVLNLLVPHSPLQHCTALHCTAPGLGGRGPEVCLPAWLTGWSHPQRRRPHSTPPKHCTALHCTALHSNAMHCTALHYTAQYIMLCSVHCTLPSIMYDPLHCPLQTWAPSCIV